MPEEGFFRAGRTRPGPRVHGPRTGPPPGGSRPGGGSSRRPRWDTDAGITDRDVAALSWLGQQYAARSDVLRVLLGRLSPGSPRIEGQLGEATPARRARPLGGPRPGRPRPPPRPPVGRPHRQGPAAGRPRCAGLVLRHPPTRPRPRRRRGAAGPGAKHPAGGRWLSERELRREAGKSHVPDAAIQLPDAPDLVAGAGLYGEDVDPLPKRIAVEVELTRKGAGPAARGLDPTSPWPLAPDLLLRPA